MNNIIWIPVEGFHGHYIIAAHQIANLRLASSGERKKEFAYQIVATVSNGSEYILHTSTQADCMLFLADVIGKTGGVIEMPLFAKKTLIECNKDGQWSQVAGTAAA